MSGLIGGPLIAYGGRIGRGVVPYIGDVTDPANDLATSSYIQGISGLSLDIGRTRRMNQALTNSAQYLIDKQVLLKAIVEGSRGDGGALIGAAVPVVGSAGHSALHVPLPSGEVNIPIMNSLANEYRRKYNMLISQGIPAEMSKRQAEDFVTILLNDRIATFAPAFPGLIEKGNELTPLFNKTIADSSFNVLASGAAGSNVSRKKRHKRTKEQRKADRKKYKQYYKEQQGKM